MLDVKTREERLAMLLHRALELLPPSEQASALKEDARALLIEIVAAAYPDGEAPPGVESIQAELREVAEEEGRRARNRRKSTKKNGRRAVNRRRL